MASPGPGRNPEAAQRPVPAANGPPAQSTELVAVAARDLERRAGGQHADHVPLPLGPELAHEALVDDRRAVDAHEAPRVEPRLQAGHGLAVEVRLAARVQLDVIVGGLDPLDLVEIQEDHA